MTDILAITSLVVRYGSATALHGVSLRVGRGKIVALLGANGGGKSTLLQAIMGIVPVAAGMIQLDGRDITNSRPEFVVRAGVALSPEGRRVFARLLVHENLRLAAGRIGRGDLAERLEYVLTLFPILSERFESQAGTLSGGQQQQLAIARALMSRPRLLLLDEPSLGLAPRITAEIFELIAQLAAGDIAILLVEQNVERALKLADYGYVLKTGHVLLEGETAALVSADIEEAYLGISTKRGDLVAV